MIVFEHTQVEKWFFRFLKILMVDVLPGEDEVDAPTDFFENMLRFPGAVTFALVVRIAWNLHQMKDLDKYFTFEKNCMQIWPLARKLQPPEVGHLGRRQHLHRGEQYPSSTPKICSDFGELTRNSSNFQAMDMIFMPNESLKSIFSNGVGFILIR